MSDHVNEAATNLYHAVNAMLLVVGRDGEIDSRHESTAAVMQALRAIDGGQYTPELQIQAHPSRGVVDEAMVESPLVPVSSADIEAACRHACRLQSINPDQKWLRGCEETNWQRIQGTVGAALHHYAVGLRNKLWNGKPLTEVAAAQAAALPAVPDGEKWHITEAWIHGGTVAELKLQRRFRGEDKAEVTDLCGQYVRLAATPAHDQPEGADNA